ncbi:hypothetical protein POM88_036165 [Heracleum sosnowskyi]|uniref:Uncharacterized protein n=1 Tax=Heracleum sosnowskyi TaxID=360622 RepID=A0AAD8HNQ4_9APIA|nr:hypothetical protein POM88_036165 [Heracleum sosnowskyi]
MVDATLKNNRWLNLIGIIIEAIIPEYPDIVTWDCIELCFLAGDVDEKAAAFHFVPEAYADCFRTLSMVDESHPDPGVLIFTLATLKEIFCCGIYILSLHHITYNTERDFLLELARQQSD